ncbi:MAG: CHAT domain-containing protein, partial [Halothece sp.]
MAYQKRILGNQAENKEASLNALQNALTVFFHKKFPQLWATTQMQLGVAYRNRIRGNQAENKETSRTALENALTVFTHEKFPKAWAEVQYNLGNTYRNRIQGDQAENKETSIKAYQKALTILTPEHYPILYAVTEMKLGNAYRNRIQGEKADNLKDAIDAYYRALAKVNQENSPTKWARIQMNLSTAYRQQGEMESAIAALNQALTVYTYQDFPQKWARIQANLGNAYCQQGETESAIAALNQALTIYTHQDFPIDWGKTQLSCGDTYQKKYHQDKQPETKAKAITAYQNALTVFTPDSHPPLCLRAATYLGNFALTEANWELAIEAYQKAITATEQLRNWATNDQRRQEILKDAVDIYANLIHAYVQVGEADKALEIADRSRAQHLVDLMSSNDLYQDGDIPESVQQLLQQYQQTQKQLNQLRDDDSSSKNDNSPNRRPLTCKEASELSKQTYQQHNQAISQLQDQLHQLWLQIRQADSVLAKQIQVTPLSLSQMQGLLSQDTALISFFTTRYHTHIFILRQNAPAEVFTCEGKNRETLQTWLKDHWLLPYTQKTEGEEKLQNWKEQMPSLLAELSQRLQLKELVTNHLQNINELIIIPHLYLHQIPFAALPVQGSYLGDQFTLRIAPSCQILDFCVQRQLLTPQALGVIENASNDLIFSSYEGEEIIKLYENYSSQRLTGKQATLDNYEQLTQNVQILHSSHHAQAQLTQPLESSLKLADGEIKLRDLLLPSWRRPELLEVFLSCCETQLGKVEMTDDLLSLSAGFLIAGA